LLLSRLLADNPDGNLTPKQREFAATIYKAGSDLLALIDDILDLSKIEAGRVGLNPSMVDLAEIRTYVEQAFRPQAEDKKLEFSVRVAADVGPMLTDSQRLQQILRNLLSNAIKFTSAGSVELSIDVADAALAPDIAGLNPGGPVIAFAVTDTGIGIAVEKLAMIFEAFQQADGTTSRRFGGTGLGLSISKELARMLGGRIDVRSTVDVGSTFTLYLPSRMTPAADPAPPAARTDLVELPVGVPIIGSRPPRAMPSGVSAAARHSGADHRRRCAQRLRAHQRAGDARAERALRRQRSRRDPAAFRAS